MPDDLTTSAGDAPHPEIVAIHARLDEGDARMSRIEANLKANTESTQRVESSVGELIEWFSNGKGAFKVLEALGKLAKPLAAIVGLGVAIAAAYTAWRTGATPK
ncbi:hypothetical protein QMO14_16840 [Variovorax sp. CAN2819]|uniref:hypothetical protein n=1 Tax=Variovorax sp. CAN15 TaxID=3046727 RepID=UPI00264A18CF|nr:hypothetical protein [Variovorax sp. CAN15]MDN6885274.1 hypothetical protein [Variovorax sp. CAN15]